MEGTCYGNYLAFDDCSITSQSGFTLSIGRWGLGLVDWNEHLSVVGHGGGHSDDHDNKERWMMQMNTSHEQDDNIFYNCYECYTNFHYFIFRFIDLLQV
jgi:hypothetical protein